jgi:hypothetical protein
MYRLNLFIRKINVNYRYSGKINPESILGHLILSGLTRGP